MFAADGAWPGWGRSACRSAAKTSSVPMQALDAHRGGDVGDLEQVTQVVDGEHEHAEHAVGAVDEGEALLLGELRPARSRCRAWPLPHR